MRGQRRVQWTVSGMLILGLAGLGARAQTADPVARERMKIWVGHWSDEVQIRETPYSHAAHHRSDVQCGWSPDRGFMVCEYLGLDGRRTDHLSIFTYNEAGRSYKHLGISQDYKTLEEAANVDGNVWTTPWEDVGPKGEKLFMRDVYEFVSPEKQLSREEYSTDGGQHWTELWEVVATKVP